MNKTNFLNLFFYLFLGIFSFLLNFYVGSSGVFPVDTFIHYDYGFRILLGEHPVKDYWIVHGFIIDYIQALFFKIFGNNWYSYILHSSFFNSAVVLFTFYIFKLLELETKIAFLLSVCTASLAYPVSGTPFLDLHSSYFSLFGIYFAIIAILKNKSYFWFWCSFFLCIGFFSKQVPAAYTIILISIINIYLFYKLKRINIFLNYISGASLFLILLVSILIYNKISLSDFILQLFLFPQSIGTSRYENYSLGIKNIFLDYKFIYFSFLIILFLNLKESIKKNYISSKNFYIFLIFTSFVLTTIFHQIYTKNQIYIFFLIPLCSGFAIFYSELINLNHKKKINFIIIFVCLFSTIKYYERFNIERKFHELNSTTMSNSLDATKINSRLKGLKWISPYFKNPQEEIDLLRSSLEILKNVKENKMVITQYNFFSSLLEEKLFSPSRTYDYISYPRINSEYYNRYKAYLINTIKDNKIENIFILEPNSNYDLNEILLNYISPNCFDQNMINNHLLKLNIKKCRELE
tara:strand:+ start:2150 stop:3712 length:1563 start_codon:yes stop_codon:yes gene_type:complete